MSSLASKHVAFLWGWFSLLSVLHLMYVGINQSTIATSVVQSGQGLLQGCERDVLTKNVSAC